MNFDFRYEATITAQFFGHTHFDEFEIFYDTENPGRAVSVAYIGPSVTPYVNLNPGYRIYYVDGDHDHTTRVCESFFRSSNWTLRFVWKIIHLIFLFFFVACGRSWNMGDEFKGSQFIWLPHLVQVILSEEGLFYDVITSSGLGWITHASDFRKWSLWHLL